MYMIFSLGMALVFLYTLEPLYLVVAGLFAVANEIEWLVKTLHRISEKAR